MKRDLELIKEILLAVEAEKIDELYLNNDKNIISYHVKLLGQANYLEIFDLSTDGDDFEPKSLTWQGHEFLDIIRNDTVWKNMTTQLKEKFTSAPVEIMFAWAKSVILQQIKDSFGIDLKNLP